MNAARHIADFAGDLFPEFPATLRPPTGELKALDAPLYEVAPGVWSSGMPAFDVPSHVLCRIVPVADKPGQFTLEPESCYPGYVRMGDDIGKRLGVIGLSDTTMRRLLALGYIDHIRPHPNGVFVSLESLLEHFKRTANDCQKTSGFWTPARVAEWRTMIDSNAY